MKTRFLTLAFVVICFLFLMACGLPSVNITINPQPTASPALAEATPTPAQAEAPILVEPTQAVEAEPTTPAPVDEVDNAAFGRLAREHIAYLSQTIGPRIAGSESDTKAANYIKSVFDSLGYETQIQPFSFEDSDGNWNSQNVLALKEGASDEMIVVGAHYDSTDEGGVGADDNASGVGAVLELAARLEDVETPYTITFVAFGAEEVNLDGSFYYVDHLSTAEKENMVAYINLDSISAGNNIYLYGDEKNSGALAGWLVDQANSRSFEIYPLPASDLDEDDGTRCECADYDDFQLNDIPFVYFEATDWTQGDQDGWTQVNEEYGDEGGIIHTEYDDLTYIDKTFPGRVDQHLNVVVTLVYDALTAYETP